MGIAYDSKLTGRMQNHGSRKFEGEGLFKPKMLQFGIHDRHMTAAENSEPFDWDTIPDYYCPECTALRFEGEPSCSSCDARRPDAGWTQISESDDRYLGVVIDDRYLISKRESSHAGMTTYRGQSLEGGGTVTVQIAPIASDDQRIEPDIRQRLADDVRTARMLDNPYILQIHELLELGGAKAALITAHVRGPTAFEIVESEGPLSVHRAVELVNQVADGLADAHRADLLHEDVTPWNIKVADGPTGQHVAFVLGFGVSRLVSPDDESLPGFTGSPRFASPEQLEGEPVDRRSDIYNLGSTLFYLLTGQSPFSEGSGRELWAQKRQQTPPTLSDAYPDGDFPEELEETVGQMIAADPEDRPTTVGEIIYRLRDAVELPTSDGDESEHEDDRLAFESQGTDDERRNLSTSGFDVYEIQDSVTSGLASGDDFTSVANETSKHDAIPDFLANGGEDAPTDSEQSPESRQIDTAKVSADELAAAGLAEQSSEPGIEIPLDGSDSELTEDDEGPGRILNVCTVDGEKLVIKDDAGTLWMADRGSGKLELLTKLEEGTVDLAMSHHAIWLALAGGSIRRIDLEDSSRQTITPPTQSSMGCAIATAPDERLVVGGTRTGEIFVRYADNNWEVPLTVPQVRCCAVSPDCASFAVATASRRIEIFEGKPPYDRQKVIPLESEALQLAFSDEGNLLGVIQRDDRVSVHVVSAGSQVADFEREGPPPKAIFFSEELELYSVHPGDNLVSISDAGTGDVVFEF